MKLKRGIFLFSMFASTALLAGCSSTSPFSSSNRNLSAPAQLPPVANSSVQTSSLPPLQGQDGVVTSSDTFDPNAIVFDPNNGDPALNGQVANADGSFVNIDEVGATGLTPGGRDISGSLTTAKLLGTWNVSAEQRQCRLNLTQTAKTGTNRFRASTPGCEIPVLSLVSSWQLTGSQIQLFDESGAIIGAFQRSGNRFVGTLSGGIAASMDG